MLKIIGVIVLGIVVTAVLGIRFINKVFEKNGDYDGHYKR